MSWPTWPATNAPLPASMGAPVQSSLLPAAINSAPTVMPPGLQYSQEQWAQAQQQNWQQWAQWQQQYQQWHQQYGAEYQKSLNALQGTMPTVQQPPLPTMPNTGMPPPLPTENRPPLPPEDPPAIQPAAQPSAQMPSYSTMPPKPVQVGYSTAPPPNYMQQQPPPMTDSYANQRQNWTTNTNKRSYTQGNEYDNAKRPLLDKPNQWGVQKSSVNQWQNQPPPTTSYQNQPPPTQTSQPVIPKPNLEELSEAEKKFDKEFAAWEAQFNKWKEQNANHPDKTQYKEYEKKWESWRNSLLERREQMRRKRLAMSSAAANKPYAINQIPPNTQHPPPIEQNRNIGPGLLPHPGSQSVKPGVETNLMNKPPPNQNNEPLKFQSAQQSLPSINVAPPVIPDPPTNVTSIQAVNKPPTTELDQTTDFTAVEVAGENFLKPSVSSGGIPGLDLVKDDDGKDDQKEEVIELDKEEKISEKTAQAEQPQRGHNLDAISKGINTILGDQKLLSMLSMVSQNPPAAPQTNVTDSVSNMVSQTPQVPQHQFNVPPPPQQHFGEAITAQQANLPPYNEQSNQSYEDKSDNYHQRESVNNFDDQTRSSFTMGPSEQDAGFGANNYFRNQNKLPPNRFGGPVSDMDRGSNRMNIVPGSQNFSGPVSDMDRGSNRMNIVPGSQNFGINTSMDNRNKFGPPGRGNFGSETANFNQGDNFRRNDFNRSTNFNRNDNFNKEGYGSYNRGSNFQLDNFGKDNLKYNDNSNRMGNNFRNDKYGNPVNNRDNRRSNFGNTYNETEAYEEEYCEDYDDYNNYNENYDNYNENFNEEENYENYAEDDDFEKYHNMFNDDGEELDIPKTTPGLQQGPQSSRIMDPLPPRGMVESTPARLMDQQPAVVDALPVSVMEPLSSQNQEPLPVEEEAIFEPTTVIDYNHVSRRPVEVEVVVEPLHMFDYRHKPLNRIPLPQRPKWLSECVKFIREFDPLAARQTLNFERPPPIERYPIRDSRRDEWRPDIVEDRFGPRGRSYDSRRYDYEGSDRVDRRPYKEESRYDRETSENDRHRFDEDKFGRKNDGSEMRKERRNVDNFEELSDEEVDFESSEQRKHQQSREEKSRSRSPILSNPPNPATTNFSEIALIEDIINPPGRFNRPPRIVIILRGPPGSGKTFLAKLIKDKEVENGGSAPRILSLDDYFLVEHEKEVTEDGKLIKVKEMVYEYEPDMEESYRTSFMKSFKKTIVDGYFPFIIVDNINDKVKHFGEMWSFAKQNGFQVYICQMDLDPVLCSKRNIHNRNEAEIEECIAGWEPTPSHHPTIDACRLLQSSAIPDVEMEEVEQKIEESKPVETQHEPSSMESTNPSARPEPWKSTFKWKTNGRLQNLQNQGRRGFDGPTWRNRDNRRR